MIVQRNHNSTKSTTLVILLAGVDGDVTSLHDFRPSPPVGNDPEVLHFALRRQSFVFYTLFEVHVRICYVEIRVAS